MISSQFRNSFRAPVDGSTAPAPASRERFALLLAGMLMCLALVLPQTALACVAGPGGGIVQYESCTELQDADGGAGTIAVPAGTQLGDLLILTIASPSTGLTFTTPTNFTLINGGTNLANGANDNSFFVYGWVVNGASVPATIGLNVSTTADYLGTLMRFSGAAGWDAAEVAMLSTAAETFAPTPSITTALANSLILRMGGFDDDDYTGNTRDAAGVMLGHTTISQWETADAGASAAHVYVNQLLAGASGAVDFATIPSLSEEFRTVTMGIRPRFCSGTSSIYSSGPVNFEGCSDNDAVAATTLSLTTPANTVSGDYLVAVVTVDGNVTASLGPAAGWTQVDEATTDLNAATMAVYVRNDVSGAQASNFTWTGVQDAYGYIMRFTGTPGYDALGTAVTGSGTNVQTPSVTTTRNDSLVLRLGSFDGAGTTFNIAPTTIIAGHSNATQERSDGLAGDAVSAAAAWTNQPLAGASGTANFASAPSTSTPTRRQTLSLPPYQLCTGTNATPSGGLIQYAGCIQKIAANATSVTVATPAATALGDYLLAVVATDGDTSGSIAPPPGWSVVDVGASDGGPDATLAIFSRFADAGGAQNHSFTWTGGQDAFAYIMRFTGAGSIAPSEVASASGTGTNVSTPAITTTVADTMIVRIGAFDSNLVALNPATIMTGLNNVTQGRSTGDPNNSVSSAAAWVNQAAIGSSGSVAFTSAPTSNEQTRRVTLGIRPLVADFRISHGGSGTICEPTTITITRSLGNGVTDTTYTGTVQISTSSGLGAWALSAGSGTLIPGSNDGTASYQFALADNGSVTLQLLHTSAGAVSINLVDGLSVENASFDPTLTISASCSDSALLFQQVCSDTSNSVNTVNLPTGSNRLALVTVHRSGALTLADGSMTFGGVNMTLIQNAEIDSGTADMQTQLWGLKSAALPAGTGPFVVTAQAIGTTRLCVFVYDNIDQAPAFPTAAPEGASINENLAGLDIETTVTTQVSDSLVISAASAVLGANGFRNWTPLDSDMAVRRFSSTNAATTLAFGVSTGLFGTAGPVTVTETHNGTNSDRRGQVLAAFRPVRILNHFRISHAGSGGTCGPNNVTITAVDQFGDVLTNYAGTVTLSAEGLGDWYQGTATNAPANGTADDGAATYLFNALDNGVVTLQYEDNLADTAKNFGVTAGSVTESPFFDPSMNLGACLFRITHVGANGSTCQPNSVTLGVYNAAGGLMTGYTGAVTLTAGAVTPGNGDWGQGDALGGSFNNGTANDGQATYTFVAGDLGQVVFTFSKTAASSVNFNATATGASVDPGFDANLVLTSCVFRIAHDASGDVCTPEAITVTVVNGTGVTQTGYTGTMNLTTSTSIGDWSKTTALGTLSNTGSGAASYTFHDDDNGVALLYLAHHTTSAGLSIGLNSGSFQEDPAYDPALVVAACTIRFSLASTSATTCTTATVTLGVYNSGGTLAVDYTGEVTLSTSTNHGTWLSRVGTGTLVDTTPGNGSGTYTFDTADNGDVELVFTSDDIETLNFNATANSGAITVDTFDGPDAGTDPDYDPNLDVTGCLPLVFDDACYANQSQVDAISLPARAAAQSSRMVLMYVGSSSNTSATAATIEGVPMTLLRTESQTSGTGTRLQVYGILDANLPAAAGDYDAAFTGSANSPAMCIVALEGAAQQFPLEATPANAGQLNGSNLAGTDPILTPLTTNQNNSIVFGVALNSQGGTTYSSNLETGLWQAGPTDPVGADWAGFHGYQLTAGSINVQSDASATPNRQVQIALSIGPFVTGPPAVTGYVPVLLYETFSGNLNYRTVGNTLRAESNGGDTCAMLPLATGSTATLSLPAGSTVTAAYLYWAGSGFEANADADVTFGVDGSPNSISADEVFIIDPDPPGVPEGFFAAYKDVTGLISTGTTTTYRLSNLSVRQDNPWQLYSTCLGGWALVVVYENPAEPLNVINLFHGFQPFYFSSFTLVPRNFRMATPDGDMTPHAQVTHVTFEGDPGINGVDEVIGLQNNPNALSFTNLTNPANPSNDQYNSSVSFPTYDINLEWTGNYSSSATSYGTDVDTYFVEGASATPLPGDLLYPFGALEAEQITTRYSTSGDYVLLVGEFISVTNAPIADLEVFVSDGGTWKVNSNATASYTYSVTNNGNGAASGGFASGDVILTGNMPNGITIDNISAPGWDCALATSTAFTCIFEIATANVGSVTDGELDMGEFLPNVVVTVDIGTDATFTLLENEISTVARLAHVGDYYEDNGLLTPNNCQSQGAAAGVQPNPNPGTGCYKAPQFDNVNDLNKYLVDIDDLDEKSGTNNNVHSNTRNVFGIQTNLSMNKALSGILETNEPAIYQLTVSNAGPDATTKTVTVTDTLPGGLVPLSASGTGWTCNIAGQLVTCTRAPGFPIASGGSAPAITITTGNIVAPAVAGSFVSNTATVSAGTYNFDTVPANNSDTELTEVTGPLAAATEKFLISVTEDGSTLGGLTFDDGDLVLYDPVAGTAAMFLDASAIPGGDLLQDIDAVHLLPNGQVILSTTTDGASINGLAFNAEDLVLYDPITQVATLIFDGSAIFSADTADIDSVHVLYNNSYNPVDWDIVLSTSATATIGALTFQDNDIVYYDMSGAVATLRQDGNSADLFNGAGGDISALYVRYNDANKYILSTSDASVTIATSGEQLTFENGELVEIDLNLAMPATDPLFCDNVGACVGAAPIPIFTPASLTRRLDAAHVIESGYFGHFAVTSAGGDTCSATSITIRKHVGVTHATETHYRGSIIVSNSLNQGVWAKDVTANGTLTDLGGGQARYTFAAADNGEVILFITGTDATNSFNVNIRSNVSGVETVTRENAPTEDPNIVISNLVTAISYADNFGAVAYTNNDGNAGFDGAWVETNDDGTAASGKVRITSGQLRFNNLGGGQPSLARQIDFSGYTVDVIPKLSFNYTISGSPSGTFVAEARDSDVDATWTQLWSTSASSGSGTSGVLPLTGVTLTATTQIRFRIDSGYSANSSEFIFVDNVQVSTETYDCNAGDSVDHYAVTAPGTLVSCLATMVTVTPHTITDLSTEPGAGVVLTLNTTTGKGFWGPPINGNGAFNTADNGNGQATYVYQVGDDALTFPFYYTELANDGTPNTETVSFIVTDSNVPTKSASENSTITVSRAGLRFFNETDNSVEFPTLVAGAPSNVFPADVLTIQAVKASESDPLVCEAYFDNNVTVDVELAFECVNPANCSTSVNPVAVTNNGNTVNVEPVDTMNVGAYVSMPLQFTSNGTYSRAVIALNYLDAGSLQMHGRHNILVEGGDQDAERDLASGDFMEGSGSAFVVRPFAFDIDFTGNRASNGNGNDNDASSWATTASKAPAFMTAGQDFAATVRAVLWECIDDDPSATGCGTANPTGTFDGTPAAGADLYFNTMTLTGNRTTPNFGKEIGGTEAQVTLTHDRAAAMPLTSTLGTLTGGAFTGFADGDNNDNDGEETHNLRYSEVGIINLLAQLDDHSYLGAPDIAGGARDIRGTLLNVGRFKPADFLLSTPILTARPLRTPSAAAFTYLGEEFGISFTLTARNAEGGATQNYVGDFARLRSSTNPLSFYAVEDFVGAADGNYTTYATSSTLCTAVASTQRLCQAASAPIDFTPDWAAGAKSYAGRLILGRQLGQAPEAPRTVRIGIDVVDSDGVVDFLNVNPILLDDNSDDVTDSTYNLLAVQEFRYGRIRLENAYSSEIADFYDHDNNDATSDILSGRDLALRIVAEYFDGTEFVPNALDIATPYSSANLSLLDPDTGDGLLTSEPTITAGSGKVYLGLTQETPAQADVPLYLGAPGEGDEGQLIIQLDLDALGLGFLKFDWRDGTGAGVDLYSDVKADPADFSAPDNPRALIEFGTFRGNDRIINWQEIFD